MTADALKTYCDDRNAHSLSVMRECAHNMRVFIDARNEEKLAQRIINILSARHQSGAEIAEQLPSYHRGTVLNEISKMVADGRLQKPAYDCYALPDAAVMGK